MMLGQERPFTARQNIGIVLARVQLTGIRRDGDSVNWRAEIVKCSCWYSPRCHDLWAGIAAEHRYCNFQGADALTKLYKCESAIKKRHLHFLKLLFRQAALRVGRTLRKEKKTGFSFFFFFWTLQNTLLWSNQPDCLLSPPCSSAGAFPHARSCSFLNEMKFLGCICPSAGQEGWASDPPGPGQQHQQPFSCCKSLTPKFDN